MEATKNKSIAFRTIEGVSRGTDLFNIDPTVIDVDYLAHLNPRADYGSEDFQELKNSIRESGLKQLISVTQVPGTDIIALAHGFRRFKAVMEIMQEDNIQMKIPAIKVPFNEEEIALSHITQNAQKTLTQYELALGLYEYKKITGSNINEVAKKSGIAYSKAHTLINFMETASTQTKNAVKSGKLTMNVAVELVKQSKGTTDQNDKLEKGMAQMVKAGRDKLTQTDVKVSTPSQSKITLLRTTFVDLKESGKTTFTYDEVMELLNKLDNRKKQKED